MSGTSVSSAGYPRARTACSTRRLFSTTLFGPNAPGACPGFPGSVTVGSDTRKIAVVPSAQAPAAGATPGSPITRTWCLFRTGDDNSKLTNAGATAIDDGPADLLAR